ncbi:hypothetical protein BXY75_0861 [Ulvibacter antarcticus]|uniref:Uncharacterized protein n=1 Tax=Ulvibacter antarcticus TaxID=442714 RepID=A0A3L9Z0P5_9FLAO|nr:hypothetical protein BXY75_0861 [Ulvibacter antarcticus]
MVYIQTTIGKNAPFYKENSEVLITLTLRDKYLFSVSFEDFDNYYEFETIVKSKQKRKRSLFLLM